MITKNLFENKILKKKYALLKINTSIKPTNINQEIQTSPINRMNNTEINLQKKNIVINKKTPEKILLKSIYNLSLSRNYNNSPMKTFMNVRNKGLSYDSNLYSNRYKDNNTANYTMSNTNYTIDNTINNSNHYTINNTVNNTIYKSINYSMNNTQNSENLKTQSQNNNENNNINKFSNNIEYNNINNTCIADKNNEMNNDNQTIKLIKSKKKKAKNSEFNLEKFLKEKLYSDIEKKMEIIYKKKNLEDKRLINRFIHMHQVLTFWEGVCNYVHPIISIQKLNLNKNNISNKKKENEDNKELNNERLKPLPKLLTNEKIWEKRHKEKIKKEIEFYQKLNEEKELKYE
jgi:CUB/sushi domain-containing protein